MEGNVIAHFDDRNKSCVSSLAIALSTETQIITP